MVRIMPTPKTILLCLPFNFFICFSAIKNLLPFVIKNWCQRETFQKREEREGIYFKDGKSQSRFLPRGKLIIRKAYGIWDFLGFLGNFLGIYKDLFFYFLTSYHCKQVPVCVALDVCRTCLGCESSKMASWCRSFASIKLLLLFCFTENKSSTSNLKRKSRTCD